MRSNLIDHFSSDSRGWRITKVNVKAWKRHNIGVKSTICLLVPMLVGSDLLVSTVLVPEKRATQVSLGTGLSLVFLSSCPRHFYSVPLINRPQNVNPKEKKGKVRIDIDLGNTSCTQVASKLPPLPQIRCMTNPLPSPVHGLWFSARSQSSATTSRGRWK